MAIWSGQLDAKFMPPPHAEIIKNARLYPMTSNLNQTYGVFREDGSFCDLSRITLSRSRLTPVPNAPQEKPEVFIDGQHLYGGIARKHFGHFLMESLPRLWWLDHGPQSVDSSLYLTNNVPSAVQYMQKPYGAIFNTLCSDIHAFAVNTPIEVEELIVPTPSFGYGPWVKGAPVFRDFIRRKLHGRFVAQGPEKIYISRSGLPDSKDRMAQEDALENVLEQAGYHIFHPQNHTIEEQCQHYLAARVVLGGDGSPFHLAAFLLRPGTKVGLIQRRNRPAAFQLVHNHIKAFSDVELISFNPLKPLHRKKRPLVTPIDFDRLVSELTQAGFL